jgi:hypothetical protein
MLRTAVLLVLALVALPVVTLRQDAPLDALQWSMLRGGLALALRFALLAFVASELSGNYSQWTASGASCRRCSPGTSRGGADATRALCSWRRS